MELGRPEISKRLNEKLRNTKMSKPRNRNEIQTV